MSGKRICEFAIAVVIATAMPGIMLTQASAGFIEKRYYNAVSPAMMAAIETIVTEHAKMMRHRRH